ncbi:MAG: acyltransferase family protein, partial [Planctomycetes bacterium]|nr:acyltransferase family protein [Planctomycetota bacterium]
MSAEVSRRSRRGSLTPDRVSPVSERSHGFDALRAGGALLVILLHAVVPYMVVAVPGLLWPTTDPSAGRWADGIFWAVKGFVMPLFFLIAGYFAAVSLRRKSAHGFIAQRTKRILLPFVVAT